MLSSLQDIFIQMLPKIDNGIIEVTFAIRVIALSSSSMSFDLRVADFIVSHVVFATFLALLKVGISVELRNVLSVDS